MFYGLDQRSHYTQLLQCITVHSKQLANTLVSMAVGCSELAQFDDVTDSVQLMIKVKTSDVKVTHYEQNFILP